MRHPAPTVVLILSTDEVLPIAPGSYAARFACGETISLDPYGREADAEVYCEGCGRRHRAHSVQQTAGYDIESDGLHAVGPDGKITEIYRSVGDLMDKKKKAEAQPAKK